MNNHKNIMIENIRITLQKIAAIFFILSLWLSTTKADNLVTSGTTVRINSGTFVTMLQNVVIENGGGLAVQGTLTLKNNLTNQNTVDDLGSGTIEFSGSTPQSISGQNTVGSLVLNNPAGLDISGNTLG